MPVVYCSSLTLARSESEDTQQDPALTMILLMDKILHDPKDPKLWELWYIPYYG